MILSKQRNTKSARNSKVKSRITSVSLLLILVTCAASFGTQQSRDFTLRAETDIVLVNVSVRDKSGNAVRDLTPEDFTLLEDGRPQQILSFDLENADAQPPVSLPQATPLTSAPPAPVPGRRDSGTPPRSQFKDHRLIILFFDLSSMQPDEIDRAAAAARGYVEGQMAPADLVAVVSLANSLRVNLDFTADRDQITKTLQGFSSTGSEGFDAGSTGSTEGTPDTGQAFTADDSEFNIFNTDRRLQALRSVAEKLSGLEEKKSLIYLSGGMARTGIENQSELRAAINAAVRSNLAIYAMDMRGLQAVVPGGSAQSASLRGTAPYSGRSMLNAYDANFSSQETLVTLAGDTGGRAYTDSNDFGRVFKGVQEDSSSYYLLGFQSSKPARDGAYRKITVSIRRPGLKIDYRRGYYAPADFQHSTKMDRERQLAEELASDLPSTDLPVYLASGFFRLGDNRFFAPVSLAVPGSQIPFFHSNDQDKATVDVIGIVQDGNKRPYGQVRDTVKLAVAAATQVQRKNVQYDCGFVLPAGKYHLKFVIRENETGRMGSFETDLVIPDLKSLPLKMSSVVLANQIRPAGKTRTENPLVKDGSEVIPSVTRVFTTGQHLYLYYEVYDPARQDTSPGPTKSAGPAVRVMTNVIFFQGKMKAYETPLVEAREMNARDRKAVVFQLDVPLAGLKPGPYTCQVNVIDDAAGRFVFPRIPLLIR